MAGLARWTASMGMRLLSSSEGSEEENFLSAEEATEHEHEEDVSCIFSLFNLYVAVGVTSITNY